ncbi:MAG: type II toxin-antitoxin system VapC family toxin [Treponemataceae bacterium]|nr:type II toxin-antitoxin system VapC family toxin [Treponemataceae bacterium]
MNEIVIDASCILEFLLNQGKKDSVVQTVGFARIIAPACISYEIGNAISKLIKRNLLSIVEGISVYHEFSRIPIRLMEPDIPDSIMTAGKTSSYAYDAYYLSLAQQLSLPLFTMDEGMKTNALSLGVKCL